eukprot:TRINITY_DN8149_c0_g2_i1.p1 TRINITY_DN8149_c0_g2~~TRINITY_DN8149_c0_g2_i1.p1  ORF type:complete len:270 (+),score=36.00 TRINITY_DN8149_c0_g2_i1:138-947(+)
MADIPWSNDSETNTTIHNERSKQNPITTCSNCGHQIQCQQGGIHELLRLPAGVKFDPSDQEILEHLKRKATGGNHPLIDEFIPTLGEENGICYTHPEKLPGVSRDGLSRHFFHRPSKAYTTGTRKRRKVHTDEDGSETRWHKTGKTRPVRSDGKVMGYKKIMVLYTNYGKRRKPEKTYWVMHQYHLGSEEDEKDGEIVVSKVFYQTQPRQCGSGAKESVVEMDIGQVVYNSSCSSLITYDQQNDHNGAGTTQLIAPNFHVHATGSSFLA